MTSPPMLTIQYLEDSPALAQLDMQHVIDKLHAAAERLPITHLLVGWHVPLPILEACRVEAEHLGMRFLRWQPLLTPDPALHPHPEWRVEGLMGGKLVGYRGLPEFTFACPNHPAVQETILLHLEDLIRQGFYQGFFIDRIRFPSPAAHPLKDLACFCIHCQRKAVEYGLDLAQLKARILGSAQDEIGNLVLVKSLLSGKTGPDSGNQDQLMIEFLAFRKKSIGEFLALVTNKLRNAHLEIGLDCFSPGLTHMVGQDLITLSQQVDWIKLMTYAHTFAPAGIPFELSGLSRYLTLTTHLSETQALDLVGQSIGLALPTSFRSLEHEGLTSGALVKEVRHGVSVSSRPVLAGIELVDLDGLTHLRPEQITSDLKALQQSGIAGLALSWDLLHIPLKWLDLVRQVYLSQANA